MDQRKFPSSWVRVAAAIRGISVFRTSPSGTTSEPIEAEYRIPDTPLVPLPTILEQFAAANTHVVELAQRNSELAQRIEVLALEVGQLRERTAHLEAEREQAIAPLALQLVDHANIITRLQAERDAAVAEVERLQSPKDTSAPDVVVPSSVAENDPPMRILMDPAVDIFDVAVPFRPSASPEQPQPRPWWRFWEPR